MRIVLINFEMTNTVKLDQSAAGFQGFITAIDGDRDLKRKLMSLGIRRGQKIAVLHRRNNGVVVTSNGSRVAIGAGIAAHVLLEPIARERKPEAET